MVWKVIFILLGQFAIACRVNSTLLSDFKRFQLNLNYSTNSFHKTQLIQISNFSSLKKLLSLKNNVLHTLNNQTAANLQNCTVAIMKRCRILQKN